MTILIILIIVALLVLAFCLGALSRQKDIQRVLDGWEETLDSVGELLDKLKEYETKKKK